MTNPKPDIMVKVDVTNPGEFFACCGLLELANRVLPETEGWFDVDGQHFSLCSGTTSEPAASWLEALPNVDISNTMTASQVQRRDELASMSKKERHSQRLEDDKKTLDKLWRESPILIGAPFNLLVDWFLDDYGGGSTFKTWAGQQSVLDITLAMRASLGSADLATSSSNEWFCCRSHGGAIPFNFDATLGRQGSDRDVGFSRDPLQVSTTFRPLVELLAFIGLQRCRPVPGEKRNEYRYSVWTRSVCPELAGAVSSGFTRSGESHSFAFTLLYRTKYLKSFLPATPIGA